MDRTELRAVQGPLKERYAEDPASAKVTLSASGELGEGATGRSSARATCCSRRWSPAPG
jgi:hypothetical protein